MMKLHILHTGLVEVDEALPNRNSSRNPLSFTGVFRNHKHKIILPVSSYLVEYDDKKILIDTGWHSRVRSSKGEKKELGLQTEINRAYLPYGWAIDEQLKKMNIEIEDLDCVLLSHLHSDHASGLQLVKEAPCILTSSVEWEVANKDKLRYIRTMWEGINVKTFDYGDSGLGPVGQSFDVFGDGRIQMIATPGHSAGLSSTLLTSETNEQILLSSDVAYSDDGIKNMNLPGITVSKRNAVNSLGWVKEMTYQMPVYANHDTLINAQTITF